MRYDITKHFPTDHSPATGDTDTGPTDRADRRRGPRRGGRHAGPRGHWGPGEAGGPGGHGAHFGPGGPFGRRGRGRRGDVRAAILAILAEGPSNGYQIISAIDERTTGQWRPSAGSVYPALGLLEDEGLIEQTDIDGKRVHRLTEEGTAYVTAHAEELRDPWQRVVGPGGGIIDVRDLAGQLVMALQQVAAVGTPAQQQQAVDVVTQARRDLYKILAAE